MSEVLDRVGAIATSLAALRAQQVAIEVERDALAGTYVEAMKALMNAGDLRNLMAATESLKLTYGPGWAKVIEDAGLPSRRALASTILAVCNDGEGRWRGAFPLAGDAPRPARGTWVVYQLLSGDDVLYIGSTGSFAERVKAHARTKDFDGWRAARCQSARHCRSLEAVLIDRHRPPLNRMIPTPKATAR